MLVFAETAHPAIHKHDPQNGFVNDDKLLQEPVVPKENGILSNHMRGDVMHPGAMRYMAVLRILPRIIRRSR